MTKKVQKTYSAEHHNMFHFTFDNFTQMNECGKNWTSYEQFRFGTQPLSGAFDIYQHSEFQIANAIFHDGLMYKGYAPKDTLSLILIFKKTGTFIGNRTILNNGEFMVIDDKQEYEVSFSHHVQAGVISLTKVFIDAHFPYLHQMVGKVYTDTNAVLEHFIMDLRNGLQTVDTDIRSNFIHTLSTLSLDTQKELPKKLSNKEKIIFEIRDYAIEHANEKLTIEALALKFDMSEKTMQTTFKKLFGYTPKKFLKLLKFNLAYRDLVNNSEQVSIGEIATKYEFTNFGLFSREFKEIFGLLPSEVRREVIIV